MFDCPSTCKCQNQFFMWFIVVQMVRRNLLYLPMSFLTNWEKADQHSSSSRKETRRVPIQKLGTNHQWGTLAKFTQRWMGWEATYEIEFHSDTKMNGETDPVNDSFIKLIYPLVALHCNGKAHPSIIGPFLNAMFKSPDGISDSSKHCLFLYAYYCWIIYPNDVSVHLIKSISNETIWNIVEFPQNLSWNQAPKDA